MKRKKIIWVVVIVAIISSFVAFEFGHRSNAGTLVYKENGPIKISGFAYGIDRGISYKSPASLSFSDISVRGIHTDIYLNGKKSRGISYSITANVTFENDEKKTNFIFKGVSNAYLKPGQNITDYFLKNGSRGFLVSGACYDPVTNKSLNEYDLLVAPNFSFACLAINKNKNGFKIDDYLQVENGKWICVLRPRDAETSYELFFFENNIDFGFFKKLASRGPIISYLRNKLGHTPTSYELEKYIKSNP